jgi:hypothetical protein
MTSFVASCLYGEFWVSVLPFAFLSFAVFPFAVLPLNLGTLCAPVVNRF